MSGETRALPGAHRPHGALNWLGEVLGGDEPVAGVIVIVLAPGGGIDARIFGTAERYSLAYAGAVMSDYSVNGDFEPAPAKP